MAVGTDYLPVATAVGNNADSQTNFAGSSYQQNGFTTGIAQPTQANKIWRQASMMAAAWATLISQLTNIFIADDGNQNGLIANIRMALGYGAFKNLLIAFSATPTFDASQATDFEMTLTGNVTSSTLVNVGAGQLLTFIMHQDGTGSRTFTPPSNLPMGTISPTANKTTVQIFKVANNLTIYPASVPTVT